MQQGNERKSEKKSKVVFVALALVLCTLIGTSIGTLAWLRHARELHTMTRVELPILLLTGSHEQDTTAIELGDIDVAQQTEKTCVFGVKATQNVSYILQLAHTTNIPFTYQIYPAHESANPGDLEADGYHYSLSSPLTGAYLNESGGIANDSLHERTYGSHNLVQKNAEPLYWISEAKDISENGLDYYVLRITWQEGLKNDKETDMVYLTVGTASGSME